MVAKWIDTSCLQRGTCRDDLVECDDGVPWSDVARFFGVVVEVFRFEATVFISDKSICYNLLGVEFYLNLNVLRDLK